MANRKETGPVSKNTVSGGKQFPLLDKETTLERGNGFNLGTGSEDARRQIMGLTMKSEGFSSNIEGAIKNTKPSSKVGR